MVDVDNAKSFLKELLSKKRYTHSINVADEARKLAGIYGADKDKAYFAGLLHDVCKEDPVEIQKQYVINSRMSVSKVELASKPLWHGIAGAYFTKTHFGVDDMDIINAIRFHTVGRAGMSRLEEIVYLADLISADRDYKDVDKMRKLAYSNVEKAMFEALCFSIDSVLKKGGYIPHYTADAYNQYAYSSGKRKKSKEKK